MTPDKLHRRMERIKDPVTLCITSGKGGVGKTSITVNLAIALSQKGYKVLLVDGDMGLANVDVLLRLSASKTIRDVLESGADPLESVVYVDKNFAVLPGGSGVPEMVNLGHEEQNQLGEFITSIARHFSCVLIDTAAGIGPSVLWFNTFANHNIIVLSSDPTSLTDAYALIKVLSRDYKLTQFNLVLNFIRSRQEGRQTYESIQKATKKFLNLNLQYIGAIPEDKAVRTAILEQLPFIKQVPRSKASRAVLELADRIQLLIKTSEKI